MEAQPQDVVSEVAAPAESHGQPAASSQGDQHSGRAHGHLATASRSQVSTAVSFEPNNPARSPANSNSAGEESVLSVAEATASPPVRRVASVASQAVSGTQVGDAAVGKGEHLGRSGTPASVYGQGSAEPRRRLPSPAGSQVGEQATRGLEAVYLPPRHSAAFTEEDATPQGPKRGRPFPTFAEASHQGPAASQQNADATPHHPRLYTAAYGARGPAQRTASPLVKSSNVGTPLPTRGSQSGLPREYLAGLPGPSGNPPQSTGGPSMQAPATGQQQLRQPSTARPDPADLMVESAAKQGPALDAAQFQAPRMAPARSSTTFHFPKRSASPDAPTQQWASAAMTQQNQAQPQSSQGHMGTNHVQQSSQGAAVHGRRAAESQPPESGVVTQHTQPEAVAMLLRHKRARTELNDSVAGLAVAGGCSALTQPAAMGAPQGALVGDSEVAAAKRAKHGNDMATSAALDEGQLRLVPIPEPPPTSQQGPHAAASVHGTVAMEDDDDVNEEVANLVRSRENTPETMDGLHALGRLDSTLGVATLAALRESAGLAGNGHAEAGAQQEGTAAAAAAAAEPSVSLPMNGTVSAEALQEDAAMAAASGEAKSRAKPHAPSPKPMVADSRQPGEADDTSSAMGTANGDCVASAGGAIMPGNHADIQAEAGGHEASMDTARRQHAAGHRRLQQGSMGSAVEWPGLPQEAELHTASAAAAPTASNASHASACEGASPEADGMRQRGEIAARQGGGNAAVHQPRGQDPGVSRSGVEGISAVRVAPPRFAGQQAVGAQAPGESQATSNAQMPPTAPLHAPRRPTSRSVNQATHNNHADQPAIPPWNVSPRYQHHVNSSHAQRHLPASEGMGTNHAATPQAAQQAEQGTLGPAHAGLEGAAWGSMELQSQLKPGRHANAMPALAQGNQATQAEAGASLLSNAPMPAQSNGHISCTSSGKDSGKAVTSPNSGRGTRKRQRHSNASLSSSSLSPTPQAARAQ
ncbi:hypothetical protein WJX73_001368 [Symbiochloris irregularis]|uniref:Uncharacterized protein n=1 Tax=Symbiochloris irregularis TaxID=706552 RepID=A0AAW1NNU9_9CHLO